MIQKLEALSEFVELKLKQNNINLLILIRNVNFKFEDQTYVYENIYSAMQKLFTYNKKTDDDIVKHREKAKNMVALVEQFGDLANTEIIASAEPRVKELLAARDSITDATLLNENIQETNKIA